MIATSSTSQGEDDGIAAGRSPRNKGLRYPADPPTVEEIVAVMRSAWQGRQAPRGWHGPLGLVSAAVEMAHEGVPLVVIQRQLGHANLGITSVSLQGIDPAEIIDTVHSRPTPVISPTVGLRTAP